MPELDPALVRYLDGPGPHRLEIGAGLNGKPGWLATDLNQQIGPSGIATLPLDATMDFAIPSDSFDYIYAEHIIEHLTFDGGRNMLEECCRILKPGGVARIVTPSLGFLFRVTSSDRGPLEERYREWSVRSFVPDAPAVTNALFLNNFVRAWHHTFIYDHETLKLAMELADFAQVAAHELNASDELALRDLENAGRMQPGFLGLESMILEGRKGPNPSRQTARGHNLALGRQATQSSVSPWSLGKTPEEDASRVVSGNFTGGYNCHTGLDDNPWWRVDLGQPRRINLIRIYNRTGDRIITRRTSRFVIELSDDDLTWTPAFEKSTDMLVRGTRLSPFDWAPPSPIQARFVRLRIPARQFLHLEQVEIFGDG